MSSAFLHAEHVLTNEILDEKTNSRLEIKTNFKRIPVIGYVPVTVSAENNTNQNYDWKFQFRSTANTYSSDNSGVHSNYSFESKKNTTGNRELLIPVEADIQSRYNSRREINVKSGASITGSHYDDITDEWLSILLSKSLFVANASKLDGELAKIKSRSAGGATFAGDFDPALLTGDWRGYIGYDVIIMNDLDWDATPSAARNAIRQWLVMGGRLLFYTTKGSFNVSSLDVGIKENVRESILGMGSIKIMPMEKSDLSLKEVEVVNEVQNSNYYKSLQQSLQSDYETSWDLQKHFGNRSFNYVTIFLSLLAFAIAIGPVNLFWLAKDGQRHKLFITTPIISAVASLIFLGVIFWQDGTGGKGHRIAIVELGAKDDNNIYIHQEQLARTGVLFDTNFTIDEPVLITPVPLAPTAWTRYTTTASDSKPPNLKLNINGEKTECSGDWFLSRSEHAHVLATARPSRERIEFKVENGKVTATSQLTYPLTNITFRGDNNDYYQAAILEPGQTTELLKIAEAAWTTHKAEIIKYYSTRNTARLERLTDRPNSFSAISEKAPLIESLKSINWKQSRAIITGTLN